MMITVLLLVILGLFIANRFLRNRNDAKWTARGYETCSMCGGSGSLNNANDGAVLGNSLPMKTWTCGSCDGKGRVYMGR